VRESKRERGSWRREARTSVSKAGWPSYVTSKPSVQQVVLRSRCGGRRCGSSAWHYSRATARRYPKKPVKPEALPRGTSKARLNNESPLPQGPCGHPTTVGAAQGTAGCAVFVSVWMASVRAKLLSKTEGHRDMRLQSPCRELFYLATRPRFGRL